MMRPSLRRLAESVSAQPLNLNEFSAALLPPKPLYRRILRAHRDLATEFRLMGDPYVKAEFRRHQQVTNPVHVIGFLSQWKVYLDFLPKGRDNAANFRGKRLDSVAYEKMSDEQLGQLYELMHATKDVWKNPEPVPTSDS
ncbi:ACN9-domain-containing protein [Roridomyces roridus]|uniref:Succinate dehydrogenase assembly factor 3 n=1 Tax=Roridomyces roridus TaxID=1738132 RepID=A0AAD7FHL8_9AGAR|nr:ACN9-domain-containing protein [Roridomyces roridus]